MSDQPNPTPPPRLCNVYPGESAAEKVSAMISAECFSYFFRHLLAGRRGPHQAIISTFFKALHHECTVIRNIPACYDPDNESILAGVLADLNFRKPEPVNPRPASRRRASDSPPERKGKSAPRKRNTGTTERAGVEAPNDRRDAR
jgi:hypothetical protein